MTEQQFVAFFSNSSVRHHWTETIFKFIILFYLKLTKSLQFWDKGQTFQRKRLREKRREENSSFHASSVSSSRLKNPPTFESPTFVYLLRAGKENKNWISNYTSEIVPVARYSANFFLFLLLFPLLPRTAVRTVEIKIVPYARPEILNF